MMTYSSPFRFQNRRMKHKNKTNNVKTVDKASKSAAAADNEVKTLKDSKPSSNDGHQDIVKRLMTHSQYPSNYSKPVPYSSPTLPTYNHTPYSVPSQYQTYSHPVYDNNHSFNDYYSKDYYYPPQQQSYNQFSNINSCVSPSLSSPSTMNNFDQISNESPRYNYVFNGDFAPSLNADFDGSFPFIDGAKTQQLFDNLPAVEIKSFEAVSSSGQLTPVTIESPQNGEIKSSFDDANATLLCLSDDDVLSVASCSSSRPSPPSVATNW